MQSQIEGQISDLGALRTLCKISSFVWLVGYLVLLWLVSSNGQPMQTVSRVDLVDESQRETNMHDLMTLLEIDTQPYIVMQSSILGKP